MDELAGEERKEGEDYVCQIVKTMIICQNR